MDKIDRLLDAIEHLDRYSEKDIEALLADPEVKEVYVLLNKTKSSLTPILNPDVDAEWTTFEHSHRAINHSKKYSYSIFNPSTHKIAVGIVIGIASLAAVATVVQVSVNSIVNDNAKARDIDITTVEREVITKNDTIIIEEEAPAKIPEIIVFDNEPLVSIANSIADYYGYRVMFSIEESKALRLYFHWNQAQSLEEVIESLNNFKQIHITVKDKIIHID